MGNLLLVIGLVFAILFILTKVLEGRAKPLSAEQQQRLSRWIIILVAASLLLSLIRLWV